MKNRKIISIILLSALLVSAASCGESVDSGVRDTTAAPAEETTAEAAYPHETQDFGGYTFKVMNLDKQYGCHIRLDFDEQTGEALDDAIYNRNRRVEEQLNFVLEEVIIPGGATWGTGQTGACDTLVSSVMAGDNAYDAAYVPLNFKTSIVTDGYVMNLLDIPELHLYEEYWDSVVNQEITAGDALYTASGPFNLMTLDLSWVLLFNKEVMDIQKMEYPYQLVRDGKWTLDRMYEYVSQAANLNGDESFAYSESGSSLYGIVASTSDPMAYMTAADVHLYERSGNGDIQLQLGGERLFTAAEKLSKMASMSAGLVYYTADSNISINLFTGNRALFNTCELKHSTVLRDMDSDFGLLPMPKLDETQKEYRSMVTAFSEFLVIPKTQENPTRAGIILDVLTYESWQDVLPVYYDMTLSQKGLRDEDSIEMMHIIRDGRSISFTNLYDITGGINSGGFEGGFAKFFRSNDGDITGLASLAASEQSAAEAKLITILTAMDENK